MTLEDLRQKALFQNTIDVWIMYSEEKNWDWYDIAGYTDFIGHIRSNAVKMQKFPLCIKESGGMFERGKDKAKFLEELHAHEPDALHLKQSPVNVAINTHSHAK